MDVFIPMFLMYLCVLMELFLFRAFGVAYCYRVLENPGSAWSYFGRSIDCAWKLSSSST